MVDLIVLEFVTSFEGGRSFDLFVYRLTELPILKSAIPVALLWWSWASKRGERSPIPFAARSLAGLYVAAPVAQILQLSLPVRLRPLSNPSLDLTLPFGFNPQVFERLDSSFPSDHAVLFFAISTAVWSASRSLGAFAFAWTAVAICLPRIYAGYHYPTDILAGAALGIVVMLLALKMPVPGERRLAELLPERVPGWALAAAFVSTYQAMILFADLRHLAKWTFAVIGLPIT